jgi:hypothetical protein
MLPFLADPELQTLAITWPLQIASALQIPDLAYFFSVRKKMYSAGDFRLGWDGRIRCVIDNITFITTSRAISIAMSLYDGIHALLADGSVVDLLTDRRVDGLVPYPMVLGTDTNGRLSVGYGDGNSIPLGYESRFPNSLVMRPKKYYTHVYVSDNYNVSKNLFKVGIKLKRRSQI